MRADPRRGTSARAAARAHTGTRPPVRSIEWRAADAPHIKRGARALLVGRATSAIGAGRHPYIARPRHGRGRSTAPVGARDTSASAPACVYISAAARRIPGAARTAAIVLAGAGRPPFPDTAAAAGFSKHGRDIERRSARRSTFPGYRRELSGLVARRTYNANAVALGDSVGLARRIRSEARSSSKILLRCSFSKHCNIYPYRCHRRKGRGTGAEDCRRPNAPLLLRHKSHFHLTAQRYNRFILRPLYILFTPAIEAAIVSSS